MSHLPSNGALSSITRRQALAMVAAATVASGAAAHAGLNLAEIEGKDLIDDGHVIRHIISTRPFASGVIRSFPWNSFAKLAQSSGTKASTWSNPPLTPP